MRKIVIGGVAVVLGVSTALSVGAFAGKPVPTAITLCGVGNAPTASQDGNSSEDQFGGASFMANENAAGTQCTNDNSSGGSDVWAIDHGNVNTGTERGTEHGDYALASSDAVPGGFNGHVTDWDFNGGDACQDAAGRTVYYQSGKSTDCAPSFGPVGNFNTHGGASTGDHFRGTYGTIIFQQNSTTSHTCDVGSPMYCIQVDLAGQTN